MENEEKLPGLTFHVRDKTLGPCAGSDYKALGVITLTASVHDLDVWDSVVAKLDGLEVYSVTLLTGQLVEVANRRATKAQEAAAQATEEARVLNEELRSSVSFKNAEIELLRGQLAMAQKEIEALRYIESAFDALAGKQG